MWQYQNTFDWNFILGHQGTKGIVMVSTICLSIHICISLSTISPFNDVTIVQPTIFPAASSHLLQLLTRWGRVTHICISKLTIIGSDDDLLLERRKAIVWTYAGRLLIGPLGTNYSEILIEIHRFSFKKMHLKIPYGKWQPFCLSLNVLTPPVTWILLILLLLHQCLHDLWLWDWILCCILRKAGRQSSMLM